MAIASLLSTPPSPATDLSTRCRYKTGRCLNARVVKPNGSLLLLCEFHRDQQNRTKKRSDMKYRHHRAKKRQLDKHTDVVSTANRIAHHLAATTATTTTTPQRQPPPVLPPSLSAARFLPPPHRPSLDTLPRVSTPTMLTSTAARPPVHTPVPELTKAGFKSALFRLSSGLRAAYAGSRISPGKLHTTVTASRDVFATSRRDIVAMASPANKPPLTYCCPPAVTPVVTTPRCLSPLPAHHRPWAWEPEDVRLLEYFIL